MIKPQIIIIDCNISSSCQIFSILENKYGENNIHLFSSAHDGLNYLLSNLNQSMIVLLDINFPTSEYNSDVVFKKIREKTQLIPIIIWTAKDCSKNELIYFLNNHVFSFLEKNDSIESIEKVVFELERAMQSLSFNIDVALEQWLENQNNKDSIILISTSGKTYTANQLIEEIRMQTKEGKKLVKNINKLTINLLFRGKEKLSN